MKNYIRKAAMILVVAIVALTSSSCGMEDVFGKLGVAKNASAESAAAHQIVVTPVPAVQTPVPTPAPTPVPVLSVTVAGNTITQTDTAIDFSQATAAEVSDIVEFVKRMPNLQSINLENNLATLGTETVNALSSATNASITGAVVICGTAYGSDTTVIDLTNAGITDGGAELKSALSFLPNLQTVKVENCGLSNEQLGELQQAYPAIGFEWRIWFGVNGKYSCLTTNETILASKPSVYGNLDNENTKDLKYCTKVKNLDLGHNSHLSDCSFVAYMPDLEFCILTCTSVNSLEPFRGHTKLISLEIGDAYISNLTPLESCTALKYLNVGLNKAITSYLPLYNLPNLMKLSVAGTGDAMYQVEGLKAAIGDRCYIITDVVHIDTDYGGYYTATEGMWRYDRLVGTEENWIIAQNTGIAKLVNSENYEQARERFQYDLGAAAYCTEANGF